MARSIGAFRRFERDVIRATHGVSVISLSLHDCIAPNRVRPPHTAVHLLRPPLVPPPTGRCCRRRRHRRRRSVGVVIVIVVVVVVVVVAAATATAAAAAAAAAATTTTVDRKEARVVRARAHALPRMRIERDQSLCLQSVAYPHALFLPLLQPLMQPLMLSVTMLK